MTTFTKYPGQAGSMGEMIWDMDRAEELAALTADVQRLRDEKCIDENGRLGRWPEWLAYEELQDMVERGLMVRMFYKHLYGHTDYYVASFANAGG